MGGYEAYFCIIQLINQPILPSGPKEKVENEREENQGKYLEADIQPDTKWTC